MSCTFASKVSAECTGYIPSFRVWTLKAYNSSGNVVAEVSEDMGNNTAKFKSFLLKVAEAGYCLNAEQINYITSELLLKLPQVDNTYIRYAVKEVVVTVAESTAVAATAHLTGPGAVVFGLAARAVANEALSQLGI